MIKTIKSVFAVAASILLGLLFGGGIDLDDIKFQRNIRKLKKEAWFRKLESDGLYYERIYQNPKVREYLLQDKVVDRITKNENEKEHLIQLICFTK